MAEASDLVDEMLSGGDAVMQPKDGVMPVMAVGRRAKSSAEIEARANEIQNDPLRGFIPFEESDGTFSWTAPQKEEMAAAGIQPDALEFLILQEQQERSSS
jgi:hypothetical protein